VQRKTRRGILRRRIIAWAVVPTAIILIAVAVFTLYTYQQVTEDLVIERNQEMTVLLANQLAAELREYVQRLISLAGTSDVYLQGPVFQQAALRQAWTANGLMVFDGGVLILDSGGTVVATEPPRPDLLWQDFSERPYGCPAFDDPENRVYSYYSDLEQDEGRAETVVSVAVPITNLDGRCSGVIIGRFRVGQDAVRGSSFYGSIWRLQIGGGGSAAYLVDRTGRAIYNSNTQRIGQDLSQQPFMTVVLQGRTGAERTRDLDGREVVAGYTPVEDTRWALVVEEDWGTLISTSERYRPLLLFLLALGVLVPASVIAFGVRRITEPLSELTVAAEELAAGDFGRRITVTTGDELEDLSDQFNSMAGQLQESYANLERRVADRTRELETLNSIASVVSRSLDLDEILRDALQRTMEITEMDIGAAFRLEDDSEMLTLMAQSNLPAQLERCVRRLRASESLVRETLHTRQPVVQMVSGYPEGQLKRLLAAEGVAQTVSIPLLAKGEVLGVINLGRRSAREVPANELALLAAVGQQTGIAVENANLYEKAEESAAAAERSRLARELHDAVTQTLFSASLIADVLPRLWERDRDEGLRRLNEVRELTRGALAEMRTLLLELRPTALLEVNLGDLIRQLAEAFTGRTRVPTSIEIQVDVPLPAEAKVAFYRIVQEALNNVGKHANASHVWIVLHVQGGRARISVRDDGQGFDPAVAPLDHLGLGIMRERADSIGADLCIRSEMGMGTEVTATWPASRDDT